MPQNRVKKASAVISTPVIWYSRWESGFLAAAGLTLTSRSVSENVPSFFLLPATLRWRNVPCGVDEVAMAVGEPKAVRNNGRTR